MSARSKRVITPLPVMAAIHVTDVHRYRSCRNNGTSCSGHRVIYRWKEFVIVVVVVVKTITANGREIQVHDNNSDQDDNASRRKRETKPHAKPKSH